MIDGTWYYFNDKGYVVKDKDVGGWYLDENGVGRECIKIDGFEIEKSTGTLAKCSRSNSFRSPSRKVIPLVIPKEIGGIEIKRIGRNAFVGCNKLTSIAIPKNITVINEHMFEGCKKLTNITLSDNTTSIGKNAFLGCNQAIFYVGSEKRKQLIIASNSKIDILGVKKSI